MREKFIKYAETITSGKSMLSILKELRKICAKNNLFHEEGACLEKIYHITYETKLYEEIGDIFYIKLDVEISQMQHTINLFIILILIFMRNTKTI